MKFNIFFLTCLSFLLLLTGCSEKDFLNEESRSTLTADQLYTSPEGFEVALNGLYSMFREFERGNVPGSGTETMMGRAISASTDYFYFPIVRNQEMPWVQWGTYMNSARSDITAWFNYLYQIVRAANTIINRAESPEVQWGGDAQKNTVIAEARLIRAWSYRHLTYLWGDVPLVTEEISGSNFGNDWGRTPKVEIYDQMESDLLFAEEHLPSVQANAGSTSRATAQHYLSELYLIKGRPDLAEAKAQAAIDNPNYHLITERYGVRAGQPGVPFMDAFYDGNALYSEGNTEVLWAIPFNRQVQGGSSNLMRRGWVLWYWQIKGTSVGFQTGGRGSGWYGITKQGLDLYEAQDDRASEYAIYRYVVKDNGDTVFTTTDPDKYMGAFQIGSFPETAPDRPYNWPSTKKWEDVFEENLVADPGYKDQPYLRLAETYLLLAEAQHLQGKNDLAAENINIIRRRSHASTINASQVSIDFILDERARELFAEEHRRYTLLRLGRWLDRTKQYNDQSGPYVTERDTLYPIPQAVIDANLDKPFPQNPGW
ncbi:RagB/SusD family nutrient uptake outer membrane protein [Parapedobacter indicus]|uniref:Starch-binding associating with outer membrane n=1 Tax=Parapedobacter indicus TaxID=1477437 RepID=A0A1I3HIS2_9SPHI|nr:RagB/SusD family nutrient uptake outer membrane protein [Parapedobacter indicus]PPL03057.1 putative outer membrane starch-binding protein [Parapedobacter indicus]SFI35634.1 Starch-binding associating with outer membrane [Parapedobacter indicus]